MEGGVRGKPERGPDTGGIRIHGPLSKSRNHFHIVKSWIIIGFIVITIGAAASSIFLHIWSR